MAISPKFNLGLKDTLSLLRVNSAKTIASTKSSGLSSTKYKDILNLNKFPRINIADKEILYEENISLKIVINQLEDQVLKLKTKLQILKKNFQKTSEKNPNNENFYLHLKKIIKDLEKKLGEKTDENKELKKNLRVSKVNELEAELKTYQDQCARFSFFIKELSMKPNANMAVLEVEKELVDKQNYLGGLRREQAELQREILSLKEQIGGLKANKRNNGSVLRKTNHVKGAETQVCVKCQGLEADLNLKIAQNEDLIKNFKELEWGSRKNKEELEKKILEYNEMLEDKTETISILNRQLAEAKKSVQNVEFLPQFMEKTSFERTKNSNPPKLFRRIHKIIKAKYLFLSVFLSFLDKNNTGFIYENDLVSCTKFKGHALKSSDIADAMSLMEIRSAKIPIKTLEHWYEKFEYSEKIPKYSLIPSEKTIPKVSKSTQFEQISIELTKVPYEDISFIFDQIKMLMLLKNIPRNKTLLNIFTEDFSLDSTMTAKMLESSFVNYLTEINTLDSIQKFSIFLIDVNNNSTTPISNSQVTFRDVSKKFTKHLPEWRIIDRLKVHCEISNLLKQNKLEILEKCMKHKNNANNFLPVESFGEIIQELEFIPEESLLHLYLLSFEKNKIVAKINFLDVFIGIEEIESKLKGIRRKHKGILTQISEKMRGSLMSLDSFIGYDAEFCIPVAQFVGSLEVIGVKVSKEFVRDLSEDKPTCDLSLLKALLTENLDDSYESEFNFQFS